MDNQPHAPETKWQRFYRKISLGQLIWFTFTLTAIAATLLMGLSFYERFASNLRQTVEDGNVSLIEQTSGTCASYVRNVLKVSDSLYYSAIKKTDLAEGDLAPPFQLMYDTNKETIESIALFSMDGTLIEASPAAVLREHCDVRAQEWYQLARGRTEDVHFSAPTVSNLFKSSDRDYAWVVPVSRAVQMNEGGHVRSGILLINLRYSGLTDVFSGALLGNNAYLYVIDNAGNLLYHPRQQLIFSGQATENNLRAAIYRDGSHQEVFEGEKRSVAVKSIGYTGWKIIGVTPQGSVALSTVKNNLFLVFLGLFFLTVLVVINSYISRRVTGPIRELEQSVNRLEAGDWDAEVHAHGFYEVRHLGAAVENMRGHIEQLMEDIVVEHEAKRKSELSALQSQINPHFLYNTLDIIVWMIENEHKTEAVRVVTALARFFRISLSRGKNIITVADEVEHARSYLMIQEMRFKNRFQYEFEVEPAAAQLATIKLVLQPLVENAVYHAMEFMDGEGTIRVRAWREGEELRFAVSDNGCGMTAETAYALLHGDPPASKRGSGVGVRNVQERIQLLFGAQYGLTICSEPDVGTDIFVRMPAIDYDTVRERGMDE